MTGYTAYDLHQAAQDATRVGMHDLACRLLLEAAEQALTPEGRIVLLAKAVDASWRADAPTRLH